MLISLDQTPLNQAACKAEGIRAKRSEPSRGNHAAVNPTGTAAALAACKRCAARRCDAAWRNDSADCLLARGQQHREQLQPSGAQERSGGTARSRRVPMPRSLLPRLVAAPHSGRRRGQLAARTTQVTGPELVLKTCVNGSMRSRGTRTGPGLGIESSARSLNTCQNLW